MIDREQIRRILMIVVFVVSIFVLVVFSKYEPKEKEAKKVSLIVYGSDVRRWENLMQGAELAAGECGASVSLVTINSENDYADQIEKIKREVENGADALMIAAADSARIGEFIDSAKIKIPVVFVETGIISKDEQICISAPNYDMGYALGKEICEKENPIVKVAIVSDGTQRNSISERERGVRDAITDYAGSVVTWQRNQNEENLLPRVFLQRELVSEAVDVIVTLDNTMSESMMDALNNLIKTSKVYSVSTSQQSVYYLDQKKIKALTYQSEFGIGYIGAKYVLDRRNAQKKYSKENILFRVIDKDEMYDYDNQTLLFPFVK